MRKIFVALLTLSLATALIWHPASPQKAAPLKGEAVSVVILGGGVGGLTAALYLERAGLAPVVLEGDRPGGLITQSANVQNWPGEPLIAGTELAEKIRRQVGHDGTVLLSEKVVRVDFSFRPFLIETESGRLLRADACVIAMGTEPNYLGISGEQEFWGRGVSNCAICDGSLYRGQKVAVVGGGDAAVLEALYLSNLAKEVSLFVRGGALRATDTQRIQTLLEQPNVNVFYNTTVQEIKGREGVLSAVSLLHGDEQREESLDGLFLAIGARPNTDLFKGQLALQSNGYLAVSEGHKTSVVGVYAVGDIADPLYKQAISAAGQGAEAALEVQKHLSGQPVHRLQMIAKNMAEIGEVSNAEELKRALQESDVPVLVDFYATWCGPCKRISPLLKESAVQLAGKVKFLKVNVDESERLSRTYSITSMPTVLLLSPQGEVIERKVGTQQISSLLTELEEKN